VSARCALRAAVVAALSFAPALRAQDDRALLAEFDRAAAGLVETGDADAVRAAAAACLSPFLRVAAGKERTARLPQAVRAAVLAGRPQLALDLAAEPSAPADPLLRTSALRALARLGRGAEFAARGSAAEAAGEGPAVAAAVLAEEQALLPLADGLLRRGETQPGLWLFTAMAAAVPGDGVRRANLALTCRHVGDLDAALAHYRAALELSPADPQIRSDLGLCQRAAGDAAAARQEFWRSVELEQPPGSGPGITNLMQMEVLAPGVAPDPLPRARTALALRPDAALLRRLCIDLVCQRHAAGTMEKGSSGASTAR
jgi:tetratricopeptide (TPR) repeat protein